MTSTRMRRTKRRGDSRWSCTNRDRDCSKGCYALLVQLSSSKSDYRVVSAHHRSSPSATSLRDRNEPNRKRILRIVKHAKRSAIDQTRRPPASMTTPPRTPTPSSSANCHVSIDRSMRSSKNSGVGSKRTINATFRFNNLFASNLCFISISSSDQSAQHAPTECAVALRRRSATNRSTSERKHSTKQQRSNRAYFIVSACNVDESIRAA